MEGNGCLYIQLNGIVTIVCWCDGRHAKRELFLPSQQSSNVINFSGMPSLAFFSFLFSARHYSIKSLSIVYASIDSSTFFSYQNNLSLAATLMLRMLFIRRRKDL